MMRLTRVDLPTFGRPTTASTGIGPVGASSLSSPTQSAGSALCSVIVLLSVGRVVRGDGAGRVGLTLIGRKGAGQLQAGRGARRDDVLAQPLLEQPRDAVELFPCSRPRVLPDDDRRPDRHVDPAAHGGTGVGAAAREAGAEER